jgi:hypothetical protein
MSAEPAADEVAANHSGRIASLSVDLDNEWAYLKAQADPRWQTYPSYLDIVVPKTLALLQQRGLRITFFVVGQDAALAPNREPLSRLSAAGHEIGNHSLAHDPWLHLYSEQELEADFAQAETHLEAATGQKPRGFRGPGFSLSETALRVLVRRGYVYDATTLPSFLGPLARAYFLATTRVGSEQRERLSQLFGSWKEGFRPLAPYQWRVGEASLIEVPVTTFPALRIPIHLTYVMYLAGVSRWLARTYFETALAFCRLFHVEPSILLHPLDFLDGTEVPSLASFPGMKLARGDKRAILEDCLDRLQAHWSVVSVGRHAAIAAGRRRLPMAQWTAGRASA